MKALDGLIGALWYDRMAPVFKILDTFDNMARDATKRGKTELVRELRTRLTEWNDSINNSQVYYDDKTNVVLKSNLTRSMYEIRKLVNIIDDRLGGLKK